MNTLLGIASNERRELSIEELESAIKRYERAYDAGGAARAKVTSRQLRLQDQFRFQQRQSERGK